MQCQNFVGHCDARHNCLVLWNAKVVGQQIQKVEIRNQKSEKTGKASVHIFMCFHNVVWQNTEHCNCLQRVSKTAKKDQVLMGNKTLANQIECQSAWASARSNADKAEFCMPVTVNALTVVTDDC